jgi:hypothetical protein
LPRRVFGLREAAGRQGGARLRHDRSPGSISERDGGRPVSESEIAVESRQLDGRPWQARAEDAKGDLPIARISRCVHAAQVRAESSQREVFDEAYDPTQHDPGQRAGTWGGQAHL